VTSQKETAAKACIGSASVETESIGTLSRAVRSLLRALAAASLAIAATACAPNSAPLTLPRALSFGAKPNLISVLDVNIGDSLYSVQTRFPSGFMETGPYGADVYRIDNIEVDSIRYSQINYEFTTHSGMQLVIARFTKDSSAKVFEKLVRTVGPPSQQTHDKGNPAEVVEASWDLPHGERVVFNSPKLFVVVLGPGGSSLKHDLPDNNPNDTL
jgi:hypothetical protein